MFKEEFDMSTMKDGVHHHHCNVFENDINNVSSLQLYRNVRSSLNRTSYRCSKLLFKAIQLKFNLRTGVLVPGADLHREKRGDSLCKHCGSFESARHLLLHCDAYSRVGHDMYLNMKTLVDTNTFNIILNTGMCS